MSKKSQEFDDAILDFENEDFDNLERDLSKIDNLTSMRIDAEQGLGQALEEMQALKDQLNKSEGDNIIEACKESVINSITGQFGLASLVLSNKDGGNVTTTHNFEKGITANKRDQDKYDNYMVSNKDWKVNRKKTGYDKPLPGKRKEAFKSQETIIDGYTGRALPKDGRAHIDHIVSASEIEKNAQAHLHLTPEQRAKMATNDSNLTFTDGSANQSKGDKKMSDWLSTKDKKTGTTKAERFGIDEEMALEKDRHARKKISNKQNTTAIKNYTKDLLATGSKEAANTALYSAFAAVLKEFTQATFEAIKEAFAKRGNQSLSEIFTAFKEKMKQVIKNLKMRWKDIFKDSIEGGITSFLSNMLVFTINLFATTLKKFVSMIRAGFVSLVQAVKIIAKPPPGMTKDDAYFQAAKIMIAGLIGAASLGLSASIELFLQKIPGLNVLMSVQIGDKTVGDITSVILSSILGGILATIVIYLMDKFRSKGRRDKLQIQLVYQSGVVVEYSNMLSWVQLSSAYTEFFEDVKQQVETVSFTHKEITNSSASVKASVSSFKAKLEKLKERRSK